MSADRRLRQWSQDRYASLIKPLVLTSLLLTFVLLFLWLAGEVQEGDTQRIDVLLTRSALQLRERWPFLVESVRDISGLGGAVVLTILTVCCAGYLVLARRTSTAVVAGISVATGALALDGIKHLVGRSRPDAHLAAGVFDGLSFPSGHASMAAVVYLTVGTLVASTRPQFVERAYILAAAALVSVLIGVSRLALGAHWATDVLGGWLFGSTWAALWLLLLRHVARRTTGRAPSSV